MEWKEVLVGDIFELKNGFAFSSKDLLTSNDGDCWEVFKIGHIEIGGGLRINPKKDYALKNIKNSKYILYKGDIVMGMTDMKSNVKILGIPALIDQSNRYALNQRVACLRLKNKDIADNIFCYYQMLDSRFIEDLRKTANSGVQVNLTTQGILSTKLFLPSLCHQKHIADILSSLDAKIENNNKINAKLEEMAQALFKSWFIDFEPFKVGRDGSRPAFGSGNFVESELGMIPEGWKVYSLPEIADDYSGYSYKGSELQESDNAMVTIKNFDRNGGFKINGFKEIVYSNKLKDSHHVNIFDVLVACTDLTQNAEVIGNPTILLTKAGYKETVMSMDLSKLVPKIEISNSLLYSILKNERFKAFALGYVNGTTVLHLSRKVFKDYLVALPTDISILKPLNKSLDGIFGRMSVVLEENAVLVKTRDTLLPKLMSGEIEL